LPSASKANSRALVAEVGAILESVEAGHSELLRKVESEKRTGRLLENEITRNAKLQEQITELQRQIDVLTKTDRATIFLPPLSFPQSTS